ncbi:MAG: isopentenyl-diphosphate Delta-isomerase [Flavisolibacter sp.]
MDLILVNNKDEPVGSMEKMKVHQLGLLHRAFSVFIFDGKGRMLLQKRARGKYHGGGLWTNACCSHPSINDLIQNAAEKRLLEEMGFTTRLLKAFEFTYHAKVENSLTENEYDHVFVGKYNGLIVPQRGEVEDYKYCEMINIDTDIRLKPDDFTSWFKIAFPKMKLWVEQNSYLKN